MFYRAAGACACRHSPPRGRRYSQGCRWAHSSPRAPERLSLYILPLAYDVLNAYGTKVQVNVWMELPGREGQAIKARATGDEAHGQSNLKEESVRLRGT